MVKQFSMELAGRTLTVEIGKVAAQANGAALMRYGDTVVLSKQQLQRSQEKELISSLLVLNLRRRCTQ